MSTVTYTSVPTKRLAESISGSSTTFKLSSITGWDGASLTSADFGSRLWAVFRNSANTLMEIMEIDPTTITSASSPITIITRGLKFTGDQSTSVSGNKLTWIKGDTVVELGTSVPQLLEMTVRTVGDQTISGIKTFSSLPSIPATPVASTDAASKGYVDLVGTGTATYDQNIIAGVAGENLTSGNVVYLKSSDGKWYVADSATASKSVGVQLGIAQSTVSSAASVNILVGGIDKKQTGLTAGSVYYLSTTGAISTTKGANIRLVGQVPNGSTTTIVTNFSAGDPELVLVDGSRTYVADTGAADVYAITLVPAISAYKTGQTFTFKATNANTTTSTLNVNGLGAKTIKKLGSTNLAANDILASQIVQVQYDGTNFQMMSPVGNAPMTSTGDASGLTVGIVIPIMKSLTAGQNVTAGQSGCVLPYPAADVTYDNSLYGTGTGSTVTSASFTVGNHSNRMLTVVIHSTTTNYTVSGVTFGGVSMTQLASAGDGSSGRRAYIFYLIAPAVSSATVVMSTSNASANLAYYIYSDYNVAQSAPEKSSLIQYLGTDSNIFFPLANGAIARGFGFGSLSGLTGIPANNQLNSGEIGATAVQYPPVNNTISATYPGSGAYFLGWYSLAPVAAGGTQRVYKTDARLAITVNSYIGFFKSSVSSGAAVNVEIAGLDANQSGLTPGTQYYLSDTPGALASSAGTVSRKAGIAVSSTEVLITNNW